MITDSENMSMIAELERIIRTEEAKPETERDTDLIDDCIREIAELKGVKADFSDEEVEEITDKLIKTANKEKKRKRSTRFAAGIAVAVVFVTGITACTINPRLANWFSKIVRLPFGTIEEQQSVTYIHQNATEEYNDIESLLRTKNLNVYYPTIFPEGIKVKHVEAMDYDGSRIIAFRFSSDSFHYSVQLDYTISTGNNEIVSEINSNGFCFDVFEKDDHYISYAVLDGNTYIIQAESLDDLILVIGGLRKEQ